MKILITGSNGLLGQKLVDLYLKHPEYEIIATSKGDNRLPYSKEQINFVTLDISDREQVNLIMDEYKPDFLINTAAMTHVDQCEEDKDLCKKLNVDAVSYLASACEMHDTFLVHLSTDFIFDGEDGPYPEEWTPNPLSYYGESKLASENIIKNSSLKWSIIRTVLVYGIAHDMSRSNIILWVKKSLEDGKSLKLVTDQWRTPTLAEDLAMGCFLIVKNQAEGVFNISGKDLLTPYDMAIATAEYFDLDKTLISKADSSTFQQKAKRPAKTGFILDKAYKELNYEPHSFLEGIDILAKQVGVK